MTTANGEREWVARARQVIHARHAGRVSVADVADAVGVSPSHLRQAFAADVGVPVGAYLARVRVDRAAELLRAGRPVKEAAAAAGFCDASHLTRRFRRLLGTTPARYAAAPPPPGGSARDAFPA